MKQTSKSLFTEFQTFSSKEWKQFIQMELKGVDYNEALVWESLEGIKVKPFYHVDDVEFLPIPDRNEPFLISQTFFVDNEELTNKIAIEALKNGVDVLVFNVKEGFNADILFKNFEKINVKKIILKMFFLAPHFFKILKESYPLLPIEVRLDVLGNLAETGNWFISEKQDLEQISEVIQTQEAQNIIFVDGSLYQNAGANIVQQIAYTLAHGNEYLQQYGKIIKGNILFDFALGSNYFFEIAKIRAFSYLWEKILESNETFSGATIFCQPTWRNKTIYDYNVNILRSATENMSAVLAGADIVNSLAYDFFFKKSHPFSESIARNQLHILKNENNFTEELNPSKGNYYIEHITTELANRALHLFKEIERNGGFLAQIKKGSIQRKIKESADKEQLLFDQGKLILTGTNKYLNEKEKLINEIEIFPFMKKRNEKSIVVPINRKRLAENLEQKRLESEQ